MAVNEQKITNRCALYNGDCIETMSKLRDKSVHLSLYSPPFTAGNGAMYHYSSHERDLSNNTGYVKFFEHYSYVVKELARVTMPGRISAVHCMDVPSGNTGTDFMVDFPGDIIRLHEKYGWKYAGRYCVWKEPFAVYLRTMQKNLRHCTVVEDASKCSMAAADFLLLFRRDGENKIPIEHPIGLTEYIGAKPVPQDLLKYKGWTGKQTENRYSQWVWRQYASAFWDDVRLDRVLPYQDCKEPDDEKHVHPLQLDVIERAVILWSNPDEVVLTPFMGVGSETYGAVVNGRKAIGIELKTSYFRQAVKNMEMAEKGEKMPTQVSMFDESTKTDWLDAEPSDDA